MTSRFAPRPMDEVKKHLLARATERRNPFIFTLYEEVAPVIEALTWVDREDWARAFGAVAAVYEARAAEAEAAGDRDAARRHYLIAYDTYHVARYPAPNSPGLPSATGFPEPARTPSLRIITRWLVQAFDAGMV